MLMHNITQHQQQSAPDDIISNERVLRAPGGQLHAADQLIVLGTRLFKVVRARHLNNLLGLVPLQGR